MRLNPPASAAPRGQAAHTLAEVMVAVLILATMTVSLFAGFSTGFAVVLLSREDERATQILNQRLEAVRLCTWSSLTNFPVISFQEYYDPLYVTTSASGVVTNNPGGAVYGGTITSSFSNGIPASAAYKANVLLLTVTVSWTNYIGKNAIVRTRQMQTQVARYGLQNYFWGLTP